MQHICWRSGIGYFNSGEGLCRAKDLAMPVMHLALYFHAFEELVALLAPRSCHTDIRLQPTTGEQFRLVLHVMWIDRG